MKIHAVIGSAEYPEYGSVTVQFPIPTGDYENILDLLGPVGMGGAIQRDCYLEKLAWTVLISSPALRAFTA